LTDRSSFVESATAELPVVPLRDMVVFPHMMAPFIVGREASVRALEEALSDPKKRIFLVTQRDPKVDEPGRADLYDIGVVAKVIQNLKLPNGNVKVMVEGVQRAKLMDLDESGGFTSTVETYRITYPMSDKLQVYMGKVLSTFEHYAKVSHHLASRA
jgi:ATP-dependent Lon protease